MPETDATWEPADAFRAEYPSFQLEDELFHDGGEMLWWATSIRGGGKAVTRSRGRDGRERGVTMGDLGVQQLQSFRSRLDWF